MTAIQGPPMDDLKSKYLGQIADAADEAALDAQIAAIFAPLSVDPEVRRDLTGEPVPLPFAGAPNTWQRLTIPTLGRPSGRTVRIRLDVYRPDAAA